MKWKWVTDKKKKRERGLAVLDTRTDGQIERDRENVYQIQRQRLTDVVLIDIISEMERLRRKEWLRKEIDR